MNLQNTRRVLTDPAIVGRREVHSYAIILRLATYVQTGRKEESNVEPPSQTFSRTFTVRGRENIPRRNRSICLGTRVRLRLHNVDRHRMEKASLYVSFRYLKLKIGS